MAERPLKTGQGVIEVSARVSKRQRRLLYCLGKEVDAIPDEALAHLEITSEVVMRGKVVPVHREVIHEIDAECRTLACHHGFESEPLQDLLDAFLHQGAKLFQVRIDFSAVRRQTLDCGDCGGGRNRMRIVGPRQQDSPGRLGIDKEIHDLRLSSNGCNRVTVRERLSVNSKIGRNARYRCITAKRMAKTGLHLIENENETIAVGEFAQSV